MEHGHSPKEITRRIESTSVADHTRDLLYGGIDGAVTTFAVVAGVEGAGLTHSVVVAIGLASVFADGFSMAASNYTGAKAERDNVRRLRAVELRHIETVPDGEREEVRQILIRKGLREPVLSEAVEVITRVPELWIDTMLVGEYGVSPVEPSPVNAAIATFVAFLICGFIPLLPYLLTWDRAFEVAGVMTLGTFFAIGAAKARTSMTSWWKSAAETLVIGGCAAAVAYVVGLFVAAF